MASIKKREDGRYRARYRDSAAREHARHFARKVDAENWLDGVTATIITGTYADPKAGKQRFHDFAVEWAESQEWGATTRDGFPRVLTRIDSVLARNATLAGIDQLAIKKARVDLSKTYARRTTDLSMTYLLAIMRAACETGRISRDPTVGARRRPRREESDRVGPDDVPTRSEVAAIWQGAPQRFRAAMALGATGLRVGEVLGLSSDRIDLEHRLVTIDQQLQRVGSDWVFKKPKGEKVRTIRVPAAVALELRRHVREYGKGSLFRLRTETLRRDQFYKSAWKPALRAAGLDDGRYVFHGLRHFAASSMLAEGVNPMAVAGHLGDTLETLQRTYAHWMRDDLDVPADALDRIFTETADDPRTEATAGD